MVKALTHEDRSAIDAAIHEAEQTTSATICVVVVSAADAYQDFILLYGLILGSLAAIGLWAMTPGLSFLWLLTVQFSTMAMCDFLRPIRRILLRFLPAHAARQRAGRMAFQEFHGHHHHIPPDQDFILLFVALAEHYVHILTNPALHQKVPAGWTAVTDGFSTTIHKHGIRLACVEAVQHSAAILSATRARG